MEKITELINSSIESYQAIKKTVIRAIIAGPLLFIIIALSLIYIPNASIGATVTLVSGLGLAFWVYNPIRIDNKKYIEEDNEEDLESTEDTEKDLESTENTENNEEKEDVKKE